ncbi:MAG TPA: DCC1-like thiol-disulfide oxidoreductase family protein [Parafilimonas sp.]
MNEEDHPIILFDGICNLCNTSVQYVIKHDPEHTFRFASLQSSFAQKLFSKNNLPLNNFNSFVLFINKKIYTRSTAALMVAKKLKGFIRFLYAFMIIPKFIRDAVYNIIAKNRYKWFGKKNECWIPTPELKNLFLD